MDPAGVHSSNPLPLAAEEWIQPTRFHVAGAQDETVRSLLPSHAASAYRARMPCGAPLCLPASARRQRLPGPASSKRAAVRALLPRPGVPRNTLRLHHRTHSLFFLLVCPHTQMVVVEQFIVYIWDPAAGRYVPDPHGGEEPPETAPDDAAAGAPAAAQGDAAAATTTAAQDDAAATAAAAAPAAEAAHPAQQQQQGPVRLHQEQPAGASQAVRSSGGGTRRRLAEGDRTKGRWWQQAVTGGRDASPTQPAAPGTAGAAPEQGQAGGGRGEPQAQAAAGTASAAQQPAEAVAGTAGEGGLCAAAGARPAASAQAPLQQAVQQREQQQAGHSQHAVQEQDRSRLPAEAQVASQQQQQQQRGAQQGRAQAAPQAQRQGPQERAQRPAELLQAWQGEQPAQPHQEQELPAVEAVGAAAASLPLPPRKVQPHKEEAGAEKKRRRGAEQAEQAPQPQVHVQRQPAGKRPRSDEPAAKGFTIPKRTPGTAALALPAEEAGGGIKGKQAAANAPFRIPKAPAAGATAAGGAAVVADHLGAASSKPPRAQQAERPEPAGEQHPQRSRPEPARRDKHDLQQQPRRLQAERRGRPEPPAPDTQLQQQQQPAEKRRPRSPPVEPASQTGQHLLRQSSSMIARCWRLANRVLAHVPTPPLPSLFEVACCALCSLSPSPQSDSCHTGSQCRNMGLVRWSIPASETALPTPASDQAASSQPALQALRKRLAAAGPWPGDDCPLPAALPAGEALPAGIYHGRIFISKRETLSACFERCLFVSNRCAAMRRCVAARPSAPVACLGPCRTGAPPHHHHTNTRKTARHATGLVAAHINADSLRHHRFVAMPAQLA